MFAALADGVRTAAAAGMRGGRRHLHRPRTSPRSGGRGTRGRRRLRRVLADAPLAELERRIVGRSGDASDATLAVLHAVASADPAREAGIRSTPATFDAALALVRTILHHHIKPC